ncbi:MAG: hypothetical protein Ct9H90mP21_2740 [Methanobacteriota archaeon]|nr:MAG: hypothetical protein Ct9H90mP21_2740 [Euryarchaeota archaeon]
MGRSRVRGIGEGLAEGTQISFAGCSRDKLAYDNPDDPGHLARHVSIDGIESQHSWNSTVLRKRFQRSSGLSRTLLTAMRWIS